MKILSLNLLAWGPFTDWSVDLSKGSEGLHLIYGPNEAGKSAALRGLKALLFGVDERSPDNFIHDYKKLRIGATLRGLDGEIIEVIRRKGRTQSLLSPEGEAIDERILQVLLGGVTADTFSRMFGLNHAELAAGGKEIASGKGDVGESLFVAALGGHSVRQILKPLEEEAGKLFAPKAAKRAINQWLEQYQEAMKEAKEASLPGREWEEHTRSYKEAEKKRTELQQEIRQMKADLSRLERINSALPCVGQRNELRKQRAEMGDVLALPEGFAEKRRATVKALSDYREKQARAQRKVSELKQQIDGFRIPEALLGEAEAITELHKLLGGHTDAMRDLPKRISVAEQLRADAAAILDDIRPGATAEEADSFKIGLAQRKLIRELGSRYEGLQLALRAETESVGKLKARIEKCRRSVAGMADFQDPGRLKDLLNRVRKFGDTEAQAEKARRSLDAEIEEAGIEIQRLPLWSGSLEQLESLALPDIETIARYEKAFADLEQNSRDVESKRKEKLAKESELAGNIKTLELTAAVPTEEDLIQARLRRDSGWKLVRAAWLEGGAPDAEVKGFGGGEPLDQAYAKSVLHADDVADRLRREADRVAQHARLISERERTAEEIRQLSEQSNELTTYRVELRSEWQRLWQPAGIDPLSPVEMRSWLQKQRALLQRAETIRARQHEVEDLENKIESLTEEIRSELKNIGEKPPEPTSDLNALIEYSQAVFDRIQAGNTERQKLEAAIADGETELIEAVWKTENAKQDLEQWRLHWAAAVKEIGLPESASTEMANQLLDAIQELAKKRDELAKMQQRIESMEHDADLFRERAKELAARVAPDLVNMPTERIAAELHTLLSQAQQDEVARRQLSQQFREQEQELEHAGEAIETAERELTQMCHFAGCARVEDLEAVERRWDDAVSIDAELKSVEKQLAAFAAGGTIENLVLHSQSVNPDTLEGEIADLKVSLAAKDDELSQVDQLIGSEKTILERMDGSSRAADAAEKAQSSLAQIRDGIERYARLRLAATLLNREVERFRARNQGPVLRRASEIFTALTLGSFAGLTTDYAKDERPILVGLRPSEERVGVEGMSEGTCDQLYLALRLASLEKHLESEKRMPFIVDDILVNFDDPRSEATLRILAELSKKTQVIFFTHHQHLIPLAEKTIPTELLEIHYMKN